MAASPADEICSNYIHLTIIMSDSLTINSLDPRVKRAGIEENKNQENPYSLAELNHLQTFEVFHQAKSGGRHTHVGSVHAPNAELAIVFAKEQYARRSQCINMWVVKTEDIISLAPDDADVFATTPEKDYREASGYKVMQKLNAFKKARKEAEAQATAEGTAETSAEETAGDNA